MDRADGQEHTYEKKVWADHCRDGGRQAPLEQQAIKEEASHSRESERASVYSNACDGLADGRKPRIHPLIARKKERRISALPLSSWRWRSVTAVGGEVAFDHPSHSHPLVDTYAWPTTRLSGRLRAGPLKPAVSQAHRAIAGTESPRHIFRTRTSEISVCRGTASTAPVAGLIQSECARPSRFK